MRRLDCEQGHDGLQTVGAIGPYTPLSMSRIRTAALDFLFDNNEQR
jgi:hypothetical protein